MVSLRDQIIITIKFEQKSVDSDEDQNYGDQVSPELPMTQEEAMRFQEENLAAAVIKARLLLTVMNMMTS